MVPQSHKRGNLFALSDPTILYKASLYCKAKKADLPRLEVCNPAAFGKPSQREQKNIAKPGANSSSTIKKARVAAADKNLELLPEEEDSDAEEKRPRISRKRHVRRLQKHVPCESERKHRAMMMYFQECAITWPFFQKIHRRRTHMLVVCFVGTVGTYHHGTSWPSHFVRDKLGEGWNKGQSGWFPGRNP